jgi:holo-[acyl-carrier protein] synthase
MDEMRPPSPSDLVGLPSWPMMSDLVVSDALDGHVQCGVDIVEIDRIGRAVERWGARFLDRVWTEREQILCRGRYPELAARFAGKEATSKALGTGIVDHIWRDIEILPDSRGKPLLFLHGWAQQRAIDLGVTSLAISLSHSHTVACGMVIAYLGKLL